MQLFLFKHEFLSSFWQLSPFFAFLYKLAALGGHLGAVAPMLPSRKVKKKEKKRGKKTTEVEVEVLNYRDATLPV